MGIIQKLIQILIHAFYYLEKNQTSFKIFTRVSEFVNPACFWGKFGNKKEG